MRDEEEEVMPKLLEVREGGDPGKHLLDDTLGRLCQQREKQAFEKLDSLLAELSEVNNLKQMQEKFSKKLLLDYNWFSIKQLYSWLF